MISMLILFVSGLSYRIWGGKAKSSPTVEPKSSHKASRVLIAVLSSSICLSAVAWGQDAAKKRTQEDEVARIIVEQTNALRQEHGHRPVAVNESLTKAARYFANYMAREGVHSHTADGNQPSQRARDHGYDVCTITENIAYRFASGGFKSKELATQFTRGWENSQGHLQNMLDGDVSETGVAIARSSDGAYYAVQMFGRPQMLRLKFKVTNRTEATIEYRIGDSTFSLPSQYFRAHRRCRASEIRFSLPNDENKTLTIRNGDHFTVTADDVTRDARR